MSNAVFPVLPGLKWDVKKQPEFSTVTQRAVSGRELRVAQMIYPLYTFTLAWEVLRDDPTVTSPATPQNELKSLLGFFLSRQGSFDSFLYDDPSDDIANAQVIGVGDGANKVFQAARSYGGFVEPINNLNVVTNVFDNGTPVTVDSTSATGAFTLHTAPAVGHSITWTGTYYYRVRFVADLSEFDEFMQNLWQNAGIGFVGSTVNKV